MAKTIALALFLLSQALCAGAHPGALDGNGCHYETASGRYHCHRSVPPNPKVTAPVKKSRANVCHDAKSPNYSTLKYFLAYQTMAACLASGGRAPQ